MKNTFIIYSSLLLLGGLGFIQYQNSLNNASPAGTSIGTATYWLKKSRKELLRDASQVNPVRKAIDDSLYFISRGFGGKSFLF